MIKSTQRKEVPAEQSGCRCCDVCVWEKRLLDLDFHCPYGGPFAGYCDPEGRPTEAVE